MLIAACSSAHPPFSRAASCSAPWAKQPCTPDTGRGTVGPKSRPAQADKLEGVRPHSGLVLTCRTGDGSGRCIACRESPRRSHGSKWDSLPLAEVWGALLPAQCRDPSPAPCFSCSPPRLEGVMGWEGEHREKCMGLWRDPGSGSSVPVMAERLTPLFAGRPKPHAACLGAASCRVCPGPAATAHLPNFPLWGNPPWGGLGEETAPCPDLGVFPPPLLAEACCSWVSARQGSGCNLAMPLSPSLPRWHLGGSQFM